MYILKILQKKKKKKKQKKKMEKKSLFFKIYPFELVAINSQYYGQNTWHQQSMG